MLAGPGAISTTIPVQNEAKDFPQPVAPDDCILTVSLASFVIFRIAARGSRWLSPIAMSNATRIVGLLPALVAIPFVLHAIKTFHADLIGPPAT